MPVHPKYGEKDRCGISLCSTTDRSTIIADYFTSTVPKQEASKSGGDTHSKTGNGSSTLAKLSQRHSLITEFPGPTFPLITIPAVPGLRSFVQCLSRLLDEINVRVYSFLVHLLESTLPIGSSSTSLSAKPAHNTPSTRLVYPVASRLGLFPSSVR